MLDRVARLAGALGEPLAGAVSCAAARQRAAFLEETHRPWPLPDGPWVMGQTWTDLLFAHWPVPGDALRRAVPGSVAIDVFGDRAWLGITPFEVCGLRARGMPPVPRLSSFPELNVRTYVTRDARPGIYFFSLDAGSRLAVAGARRLYRLPYFHARMRVARPDGWIAYESRRAGGGPGLTLQYRPASPARAPSPGSLEHWLTERYCLYSVGDGGRLHRAEIHHRPWPLQAAEAEIGDNTMAKPLAIELTGDPILHFARRQDVVVWPPARVES